MTEIIGFPIKWQVGDSPPEAVVALWPAAPLRAILGATGLSIHSLVGSGWAKAVAFQLFKAWREIERRENAACEDAYREWLAWVKRLVPVEEWG